MNREQSDSRCALRLANACKIARVHSDSDFDARIGYRGQRHHLQHGEHAAAAASPGEAPGEIQRLFPQQKNDTPLVQFSIPNFRDIRSQSTDVYSDVIAHTYGIDGLAVNGKSDRVVTEYVRDFFSMFGLKPALGRPPLPSEGETPMADPVIVLSYSYWKTRFGGSPGVVGKQVSVDGHSMTVVGVAPEGFTGLNPFVSIQAYMPLAMMPIAGYPADLVSNRQSRTVFVMARLEQHATIKKAQAELDVIGRRLSEQYPSENKDLSIQAFPEVRGRIVPSEEPNSGCFRTLPRPRDSGPPAGVRERSEPLAGARHDARTRNGDSSGARSRAQPLDQSASH